MTDATSVARAGGSSARRVLVEACCDSVPTAVAAAGFGSDRIELCGPGDGGTTPSAGLMARCRDAVQAPIHVMIRPHTHSFVYDEDDIAVMLRDIETARALGMDGIVMGPLRADGNIQREQLQGLVSAAGSMRTAFHRAFDRTPDAMESLALLMEHGVGLVLTSGHAATAFAGARVLRDMRALAGERLVVLAGGGVRGDNVRDLVAASGVAEVHARSTDPTIVRDVIQALEA